MEVPAEYVDGVNALVAKGLGKADALELLTMAKGDVDTALEMYVCVCVLCVCLCVCVVCVCVFSVCVCFVCAREFWNRWEGAFVSQHRLWSECLNAHTHVHTHK